MDLITTLAIYNTVGGFKMNNFSLELKNKVVNDYNQGLLLNLDTYLREI